MQKQEFLIRLGKRIVEVRKNKNLSQANLAWQLGRDPQSIERIENGKINTSIYNIKEICESLEIPLSELLKDL